MSVLRDYFGGMAHATSNIKTPDGVIVHDQLRAMPGVSKLILFQKIGQDLIQCDYQTGSHTMHLRVSVEHARRQGGQKPVTIHGQMIGSAFTEGRLTRRMVNEFAADLGRRCEAKSKELG